MTHGPAIAIDRVSFAYPDGAAALHGIAFELAHGERVAIIGANGAGKSTLLLHLNGLILPTSGTITVEGIRLERASRRDIRRRVGLVFQNPDDQLFCPTVFDDIAFGPRNMGLDENEVAARVRACLTSVGLDGAANKCAFHLSQGQKRRAAIATVLAMRPAIVVLDEPTSNLDPRGRKDAIALLRQLSATMIVATHDLPLVNALCPRTILLSQGRVAADGPTAAILADTALLESHNML
ncbi:MAG TPA: ABC transporter ATP-binding protein [Candidatus Hydrogenedentes bacterium]|nr:ABC transporter ATP-binding protein [Candidatus Hydrogenedentota bacterium]HOS02748.1 ABC transporter ATP-binding protein [Candidatus Hydrogenedentota bacterium]